MSTLEAGVPNVAPEHDPESQAPRSVSGGATTASADSAASGSLYGGVVAELVPPRPARGARASEPWSECNMREHSVNLGAGGKGHTPAAWRQLEARPWKWRPVRQTDLYSGGPPQVSGGHILTTEAKAARRGGVK